MIAAAPKELDQLYNTADKLYSRFARRCGISTCAYWMLYDLVRAEAPLPLTSLCDSWSYSKQTINSALKTLESRNLIELVLCEGSRKNKQAGLTAEGAAFARENIVPAMEAEHRAFERLAEDERRELVRLVRSYTRALEAEFEEVER